MNIIKVLTNAEKVEFSLDEDKSCTCCNSKYIYISKIFVTKDGKTQEFKHAFNEKYSGQNGVPSSRDGLKFLNWRLGLRGMKLKGKMVSPVSPVPSWILVRVYFTLRIAFFGRKIAQNEV